MRGQSYGKLGTQLKDEARLMINEVFEPSRSSSDPSR